MGTALVVSHSFLEQDPRVRRTVRALLDDGWLVEGLFLDEPIRRGALRTWRVPMKRRRGSMLRHLVEYGVFFILLTIWVFRRAVLRKADVVLVNSPPEAFTLAALPAKLRGSAIVLDVHDPLPELLEAKGRKARVARKILEWQERVGIAAADRVITVHQPLRDLLAARNPSAEFHIVMNVPDTTGWAPLDRDVDGRTIVYAGSLAVRYGLDDLIEAMALVPDVGLRLRFIGEGEDEDLLRARADALGIGDRIEFLGKVPYERVRDAQSGAWIGANLLKPDALGELSFSNKVVEWVALGLPVVASPTRTLLRYFPRGTLFYTDSGGAESVATTLRQLDAMSPQKVEEQVVRAREALERIAWPVQRDRLLTVIGDGDRRGGVSGSR